MDCDKNLAKLGFHRIYNLLIQLLITSLFSPSVSLRLSHALPGHIKAHELGRPLQVLQSILMSCFPLCRGTRLEMQRMHESATTVKAPTTPKKHKENTQKTSINWFDLSHLTLCTPLVAVCRIAQPVGGQVTTFVSQLLQASGLSIFPD